MSKHLKKAASVILEQGDTVKAATEKIAQTVVEEGSTKSEGIAYFLSNLTKKKIHQREL